MKFSSPRLLAVAAVACASTLWAPMSFAQGTFTPGSGTSTNCNVGASGTTVDSKSCTVGTVTANMTSWGYTGTLGTTQATGFTQGRLSDWDSSGFGAYTGASEGGSPHHAFDNITSGCSGAAGGGSGSSVTLAAGCGGSIEGLFLNFGTSKVNLTNIGIGWSGSDADLSVWAWTGLNDPSMSGQTAKGSTTALTSGTAAQIASGTTAAAMSGWTLVSNHAFAGNTYTAQSAATDGSLYSSYFLITTYFGAASGSLGAGNDSFKLNSFTVGVCGAGKTLSGGTSGPTGTSGAGNGATCTPNAPGVPEPGSLALVGFALMGAYGIRRRKGASA